jgi:PleD family two-component response regulator
MPSGGTNRPVGRGKQSIHRRSLLVVGEDLGDLTACRSFLERSGYQVFACSSYEQAVRSLQSEAFDFVLLGSLLVALEWGRRLSVARAPALKRRVSHHLPDQA